MVDKNWLGTCATAGEFLYGNYTVKALKQMYERKKGCTASAEELVSAMKDLEKRGEILMHYVEGTHDGTDTKSPGYFMAAQLQGTWLEPYLRKADSEGNPYASLHYDQEEQEHLTRAVPETMEFYVPTEAEINQLMEEGYIRTAAMDRLEEAIRKKGGNPGFLREQWGEISTEKLDPMEVGAMVLKEWFPDLAGLGLKIPLDRPDRILNPDETNVLVPLVLEFIGSVPLRNRKGWGPADVFQKVCQDGQDGMPMLVPNSAQAAKRLREVESLLNDIGMGVDYSAIGSYQAVGEYGERKTVKVGRNDLCPCGSGLKYKYCHGKRG